MKRSFALLAAFVVVAGIPFSHVIAARQCAEVGPGGRRCGEGQRWSNRICDCVDTGPASKVLLCHIPEEAEPEGGLLTGQVVSVSPNADAAHRLKHRDCDAGEAAKGEACTCEELAP